MRAPRSTVLDPHRRHLSRKVRTFVDFLVEVFTPVPPWEKEGLEFDPEEWRRFAGGEAGSR
ncbi:MAG: hypothetical protein U5L11_13160 [Arhodomonas sp.]|nr:hypothetical protein [Arhodomonas sp.]